MKHKSLAKKNAIQITIESQSRTEYFYPSRSNPGHYGSLGVWRRQAAEIPTRSWQKSRRYYHHKHVMTAGNILKMLPFAGVGRQQLWLRAEGKIPPALRPRRSQHRLIGSGGIFKWIYNFYCQPIFFSVGNWGLQAATTQPQWSQI